MSLLWKNYMLVVSDGRGSVKYDNSENEYFVVTEDADNLCIIQKRFIGTISGTRDMPTLDRGGTNVPTEIFLEKKNWWTCLQLL